jgi:hypothetical protein
MAVSLLCEARWLLWVNALELGTSAAQLKPSAGIVIRHILQLEPFVTRNDDESLTKYIDNNIRKGLALRSLIVTW